MPRGPQSQGRSFATGRIQVGSLAVRLYFMASTSQVSLQVIGPTIEPNHHPSLLETHQSPSRTVPYRTVPYRTVPNRTIPYRTVPYGTVPYGTVPCGTARFRTVRYCDNTPPPGLKPGRERSRAQFPEQSFLATASRAPACPRRALGWLAVFVEKPPEIMSARSVAASYKPPMLVTRARIPACASARWWELLSASEPSKSTPGFEPGTC